MKIFVKAKPNSKKDFVEKVSENNFIVAVKEPPIDGKANQAILKAIAKHLNIPLSQVSIISGHKSRGKVIEVEAKMVE